jgi:AcrR family transcriptional regulator
MALPQDTTISPPADELTAAARIRNAALRLFSEQGYAATSIRAVAAEAGVSAGLVQHHFPSKETLREACDAHVLRTAAATFEGLTHEGSRSDAADEMGRRITSAIRNDPVGLRYVARGVIDGDEHALRVFDSLVALTGAIAEGDREAGRLWPETDVAWAALHVLVYNLGAVLLEHAIDRHLPEPMLSEEGAERWRVAATSMFRHGLYRPDDA